MKALEVAEGKALEREEKFKEQVKMEMATRTMEIIMMMAMGMLQIIVIMTH